MKNTLTIMRRELMGYFASPVAYVFIVIFLGLAGAFTFYLGGFFERGQADLAAFFAFHPWLYLFFIPALSMRLWADERKTGTLELLMTLPITTAEAVLGKFLAAWIFAGIALALSFPLWLTVSWLGQPDHGVIATAYLGSWLMAGGFLGIGSALSALTRNQVIAFVLAAAVSFLFLMSGLEFVQAFLRGWAPPEVARLIADLSFFSHFRALSAGLIDLRDLLFFSSIIGVSLTINVVIIEMKKAA